MNPATAFATVVVDELLRQGLRHAVVSPGSRSSPIAVALADAHAAGRLELRVHFDERSAGFLALGLAKVTNLPTAVLTTSGTATANLLPAVVEASHSCIPLVALTADRPPELRGVGANQTIDQLNLYGSFVRHFVDVAVPEDRDGQHEYWRGTVARAAIHSKGGAGSPAGPVHVNIPMRPPLVPDANKDWRESLGGRAGGAPWTEIADVADFAETAEPASFPARTLVVVGDCPAALSNDAVRVAEENGWPLISEPSGNALRGPNAISSGGWLLDSATLMERLQPQEILVVGRPTLSRAVTRALSDEAVRVSAVTPDPKWADAAQNVRRVFPCMPRVVRAPMEPEWIGQWQRAEARAREAIDAVLDAHITCEQTVTRDLRAALPADGLLVAGSSLPIRHLFLCSTPSDSVTTIANRGAAGIDGTVSTAVGAAAAWQQGGGGRAVGLMGDLTFAHDGNGLAVPDDERPQLAMVVLNNDGGGIFELLEPANALPRATFERVFAAPSGIDIAAAAAAHHVPYARCSDGKEAAVAALDPRTDLQVVEVVAQRRETVEVHQLLQDAVRGAIG